MKKVKILPVLLSVVMLISAMGGCSKGTKDKGNDKGLGNEKNANLTFIRPGHDPKKAEDPYNIAIEEYKKQYNADVEIVLAGYDDWTTKLLASIASGDPIDISFGSVANYPLFAMQAYTQPLDNYVNMKSENVSKSAMDAFFKYQGKYYNASSARSISPLVMFYNKDMFANEGVADPMELYKEGKWDFDHFKEVCMKFTTDTDNDGKIDRWGLANWYAWVFMGANKTAALKISDSGKYELNLDDPALTQSLEFIKDGYYTSKWRGLDGNDIYTSFYQGKNAFLNEYVWAEDGIIKARNDGQFDFEYGVMPMPYGPNNKEKYNVVHADGVGIISGSDSPYHAGKLIDLMMEQVVKTSKENDKKIPEENAKLYDELRKNAYNDTYYDSAVGNAADLCGLVAGGGNITTVLASIKPIYQQKIDEANTPPEKPVKRDFKAISLNFDDDVSAFVKYAEDAKVLNITKATGDEAIENGSLKIEMSTNDNGEWCDAAVTDPAKAPIYGWHKYKISFDYKVPKIAQPGKTEYLFRLHTENDDYANITIVPDKENQVVHFETEYDAVPDNSENINLLISGHFADTIIIDNLKIEEVK